MSSWQQSAMATDAHQPAVPRGPVHAQTRGRMVAALTTSLVLGITLTGMAIAKTPVAHSVSPGDHFDYPCTK